MALKVLTFRVAAIADADGLLPGMVAPGPVVAVRLVPVPVVANSDADLPGTGASGQLEVYFTQPAVGDRFNLKHNELLELVLRRPGQP